MRTLRKQCQPGIRLTKLALKTQAFGTLQAYRGMSFDAVCSRLIGASANRSGNCELAFLGDPLEGLARTLDPVLAVVTFGGKLSDNLVRTACSRPGDIAGCKVDGRSNRKLMLQRPLHHTKSRSAPHDPAWLSAGWKPGKTYSMRARALASIIQAWQMRDFFRFFRTIRGNRRARSAGSSAPVAPAHPAPQAL